MMGLERRIKELETRRHPETIMLIVSGYGMGGKSPNSSEPQGFIDEDGQGHLCMLHRRDPKSGGLGEFIRQLSREEAEAYLTRGVVPKA